MDSLAARAPERERRLLLIVVSFLLTSLLALVVAPHGAHASPSNGLPTEFRPSFPLFGPGPVVNFARGDHSADTNAVAHAMASLALPLLGEKLWGRKGLWAVGLTWIALSVVQESLFHAPPNPGPAYASEFRADLVTRVVPCATLLVWDALRVRSARLPHEGTPERMGAKEENAPAPPLSPGARRDDAVDRAEALARLRHAETTAGEPSPGTPAAHAMP